MSSLSFHERHADLLRILVDDQAMTSILAAVADRQGWPIEATWTRIWGRLLDPTSGRARMLYQADGQGLMFCTLEVGCSKGTASVVDRDLGPVTVKLFPDDRRLSVLPTVLARYPDVEVVRYRPGKRCTLRRASNGDYLKVFPDDRGDRLNAEGQQLWLAACNGAFGFSVARPLGFDRSLRTYTQAEVAGHPVVGELFQPGGAGLASRLGEASATIATSGLTPVHRQDAASELKRTVRRADDIVSFVPRLAEPMTEFMARLDRLHAELAPSRPVPIHGSPHPNQWLMDGSSIGLVDFDRLSLGDAELDVATFAAEVDFETAQNRDDVNTSFEEGYRRHYGDLDSERLGLYRAHKRLAKVHRTVSAIRKDGDVRAAAHLETAAAGLLPLASRRAFVDRPAEEVIG